MSLSDDHTSPTKKNQARTSLEPRESPQDSSFLQSVETKMSPSDDPTSPTEKNRARTGQEPGESPQDSSFLSSKELHETSRSFVSPMNRDEEALKSQHGSFSENPNYFGGSLDSAGNMGSETYSGYANNDQNVNNSVDSDTLFADSNKASLPYDNLEDDPTSPTEKNRDLTGQEPRESPQDFSFLSSKELHETFRSFVSLMNRDEEAMKSRHGSFSENPNYFERSLDSAGNMESQTSNSSAIGVDSDTFDYTEAYANYLEILKMEGSQEDPIGFDTYKAMLEDKRKREEIKMMPTPRFDRTPPEWTYKMTLSKEDVDPAIGHLSLPASFINLHIESHMAKQSKVTLKVYDHDWATMHELRLASKYYDAYALMGDWVKDFIQRRGLCEGDEIGLLWDSSSSRLKFGVVSRVDERAPAEEKKVQKEEIEMMPINRDLWPIKKKLSMTDVNPSASLVVLPKTSFEPYLRKHLPKEYSQKLLSDEPEIVVKVDDRDTETTYEICLAFRSKRNQYVLTSGWREVIIRRNLMAGQEIGLLWDSSNSKFHFSVISSAPPEEKKK